MGKTERITFEEVEISRQRSGKCSCCGKHRRRVVKTHQTINQWNLREDGVPKTRAYIMGELEAWMENQMEQPFVCASCHEEEDRGSFCKVR